MRVLRLALAGSVMVALLGGLSGVVAAQVDGDTPAPVLETGFVYGDDAPTKQVIHAYTLEPRDDPRPAVVFFHGGGLIVGEPTQEQRISAEVQDLAPLAALHVVGIDQQGLVHGVQRNRETLVVHRHDERLDDG